MSKKNKVERIALVVLALIAFGLWFAIIVLTT